MTDTEFVTAILTGPVEDDLTRLAYADWLEEQGDPRAEFVRAECRLRRLPPDDDSLPSERERLDRLAEVMEPGWVSVVDRSPHLFPNPIAVLWIAGSSDTPVSEWESVEETSDGLETVPGRLYSVSFSTLVERDVTDGSVEEFCAAFAGMGQLWAVTLSGDDITDRGILALGRLGQLRHLTLGLNPQATGRALSVLERLPNLIELNLEAFTQVGNEDLGHLKGLERLQRLNLFSHRITDEGLRHLGALPRLQHLELTCPNVTDRGIAHLGSLSKQLRTLGLTSCWKLTDAGLEELRGYARLETLGLPRCAGFFARQFGRLARTAGVPVGVIGDRGLITERGVERLQDALPNCEVWQPLDLDALRSS